MKKVAFLVLTFLSTATMAGTYNSTDGNKDAAPENNKASNKHFYIDIGANYFYFDQPGSTLPISKGYSTSDSNRSTTPFEAYDDTNWVAMPTLTLGYEFLSPDKNLQKIFGEQNAIEVKAAYFHQNYDKTEDYADGTYGTVWYINGNSKSVNRQGDSFLMESTDWSYNNTFASVGIYYTGKKIIQQNLVNSPYVGLSFSYLEQDTDYTTHMTDSGDPNTTTGSDDLESYYTGLEFGDKLTLPFKRQFSTYGKAGVGLYLLHSSLSATQRPIVEPASYTPLNETYTVDTDDDTLAYKAMLEAGVTYYMGKNNQNPLSPSLTLLAGAEYWSDVAYADNPTAANEQVSIGYGDSLNPYAGLQMHFPIA